MDRVLAKLSTKASVPSDAVERLSHSKDDPVMKQPELSSSATAVSHKDEGTVVSSSSAASKITESVKTHRRRMEELQFFYRRRRYGFNSRNWKTLNVEHQLQALYKRLDVEVRRRLKGRSPKLVACSQVWRTSYPHVRSYYQRFLVLRRNKVLAMERERHFQIQSGLASTTTTTHAADSRYIYELTRRVDDRVADTIVRKILAYSDTVVGDEDEEEQDLDNFDFYTGKRTRKESFDYMLDTSSVPLATNEWEESDADMDSIDKLCLLMDTYTRSDCFPAGQQVPMWFPCLGLYSSSSDSLPKVNNHFRLTSIQREIGCGQYQKLKALLEDMSELHIDLKRRFHLDSLIFKSSLDRLMSSESSASDVEGFVRKLFGSDNKILFILATTPMKKMGQYDWDSLISEHREYCDAIQNWITERLRNIARYQERLAAYNAAYLAGVDAVIEREDESEDEEDDTERPHKKPRAI